MANTSLNANQQVKDLGRRILAHHKKWRTNVAFRIEWAASGGTPWDIHRGKVLPWTPENENTSLPRAPNM
eukprot:12010586-Prorocentrum_lima.AAC.1